jgi:hypothetical protein
MGMHLIHCRKLRALPISEIKTKATCQVHATKFQRPTTPCQKYDHIFLVVVAPHSAQNPIPLQLSLARGLHLYLAEETRGKLAAQILQVMSRTRIPLYQ